MDEEGQTTKLIQVNYVGFFKVKARDESHAEQTRRHIPSGPRGGPVLPVLQSDGGFRMTEKFIIRYLIGNRTLLACPSCGHGHIYNCTITNETEDLTAEEPK